MCVCVYVCVDVDVVVCAYVYVYSFVLANIKEGFLFGNYYIFVKTDNYIYVYIYI